MGWCRSSLCLTHIGIDDIEWKVERLSLDHEQPWIKLNQSQLDNGRARLKLMEELLEVFLNLWVVISIFFIESK